jgi:hypothetical protein
MITPIILILLILPIRPLNTGNRAFFDGSGPPKIRPICRKQINFGGNALFSVVFGRQKYLAKNSIFLVIPTENKITFGGLGGL